MRRLGIFARRDDGAVAVIAALSVSLLLGLAALAVDVGSVFLQARKLQGTADLAALAAARDSAKPVEAAQATVAANGWRYEVKTDVVNGVYVADPSVAAGKRFVAGGASPNAVKVTVTTQADLFFGAPLIGKQTMTITRSATAARAELAAFSVGSRLVSLNGGVANALLGALTGSQVSLSVMDYDALVGAKVDLLSYASALALHAQIKGAAFDQALATKVSSGEALSVFADVLSTSGQAAAATAARKLSLAAGAGKLVDLSALIDLGPYGNQDHASNGKIAVSAMDMAQAVLLLAQEGRQVKLDLGAGVPGLADVDVWLAIGERPNNSPWLQVDQNGSSAIIRTAQTRLYIDAKAAPVGSLLSLAGIQLLDVPILVEAASAQAKLSNVSCTDGSVSLQVAPSVGSLTLGQIDVSKLNDFKHELDSDPATLLKVGLIEATAAAHVDLGGASWQTVNFTKAEVAAGTTKTVQTNNIAQASIATLLTNTSIQVKAGPLGLGLGGATLGPSLQSLLTTVATPLDGLLNSLTGLLGVHLGEADVRVAGLRCRQAALVS